MTTVATTWTTHTPSLPDLARDTSRTHSLTSLKSSLNMVHVPSLSLSNKRVQLEVSKNLALNLCRNSTNKNFSEASAKVTLREFQVLKLLIVRQNQAMHGARKIPKEIFISKVLLISMHKTINSTTTLLAMKQTHT